MSKPMTDPLILACPMPGCARRWVMPEPEVVPLELAALMGSTPDSMAELRQHQRLRRMDIEIERHLESHAPREYVAEIQRLKSKIDELRQRIATYKGSS